MIQKLCEEVKEVGWVLFKGLLIIGGLGLFIACTPDCWTPDPPDEIQEYPLGRDVFPAQRNDGFRYIQVDGHQYLRYANYRMYGFTHSPKCPCLHKEEP